MSQTENHWTEVANIELELQRYMIALGLDWHDEVEMAQLAAESKTFGPDNANSAYASNDLSLITKAKLFGLVSMMIQTMKSAAMDNRDVHGGEVWKAFAKHLYT